MYKQGNDFWFSFSLPSFLLGKGNMLRKQYVSLWGFFCVVRMHTLDIEMLHLNKKESKPRKELAVIFRIL